MNTNLADEINELIQWIVIAITMGLAVYALVMGTKASGLRTEVQALQRYIGLLEQMTVNMVMDRTPQPKNTQLNTQPNTQPNTHLANSGRSRPHEEVQTK